MSNVRVYNDHPTINFVGEFRDKAIEVPAGKYIEMGRGDAVKFLAEFSSIETNGRGEAVMPKKLRMWEDPEVNAARMDQPFKYTALDNKEFRTLEGLKAYESQLTTDLKEITDAKPTRRRTTKD
jgi:hypothetical protein